MIRINSQFELGTAFRSEWTQDEIKNEPMLFNCSIAAAKLLGGQITRNFLEPFSHCDGVVDSRVHMLMPGWYPAIPGWHHDDVPRSGHNNQPNYHTPEYRSTHVMGLVNGDICPTQFAIGEIEMRVPSTGIVYKQWHSDVESAIATRQMDVVSAPSGRYIHFDDRAFHQATAATSPGWRWFIRVSFGTDRIASIRTRFANKFKYI